MNSDPQPPESGPVTRPQDQLGGRRCVRLGPRFSRGFPGPGGGSAKGLAGLRRRHFRNERETSSSIMLF
jgi:hypothetical protein